MADIDLVLSQISAKILKINRVESVDIRKDKKREIYFLTARFDNSRNIFRYAVDLGLVEMAMYDVPTSVYEIFEDMINKTPIPKGE